MRLEIKTIGTNCEKKLEEWCKIPENLFRRHDEAPSNSDSIQKNLDGNDAEKYTLLKRLTKCNTHCYWLLAAIYRSTLQGWRYTLISFPLVWPVARVPRLFFALILQLF